MPLWMTIGYLCGFAAMSFGFGAVNSKPDSDCLLPGVLCALFWPVVAVFVLFGSIGAAVAGRD